MRWFRDVQDRRIRLTDERRGHFESEHPEMSGQLGRIAEVLRDPDVIVISRVAPEVELFHRHYVNTPVTQKYMCVVVKAVGVDAFVITAFFTDAVKKGDVLWKRK